MTISIALAFGKPLPSILVKTSLNDSQVMYWEPAKYVAKFAVHH